MEGLRNPFVTRQTELAAGVCSSTWLDSRCTGATGQTKYVAHVVLLVVAIVVACCCCLLFLLFPLMLFMQRQRLQLSVELEALLWQFVVCVGRAEQVNERVRQTVRNGLVSGLSKGRQQQQQPQLAWRVFACGSECSNINCGKLTKREFGRCGRRLKWSQPAVTHPNTHTQHTHA